LIRFRIKSRGDHASNGRIEPFARAFILILIATAHARVSSSNCRVAPNRCDAFHFERDDDAAFFRRARFESCATHRSCAILLNLRSGTGFLRAEFSF